MKNLFRVQTRRSKAYSKFAGKALKQTLCLLIISLPLLTAAQESAINWTTGLNWNQIKAKAKAENKYIFVDAYTTWCKPCKEMDMKVYTVDSVGDYLNKNFISVKVQMDSTKKDDAATKSWYKTASIMTKEYNLASYPTLLFFTPSGEVAIKEVGYKEAGAFIKSARESKDPSKQYYLLLKNYNKGKKNYKHMPFLFNTAVQLQDTTTYRAVRTDYFAYLHSLPKEKLYTKEHIEFVAASMSNSKQVVFDMFYPDGSEVNKVMKSNWYSKSFVDKMIEKEISSPFLNALSGQAEPDWNSLYTSISKSYNADYAGRNVLNAKSKWYYERGDMLKFAICLNDKIEKYGYDTASAGENFKLNNKAFLIWEKLTDTVQLERIIKWMETVVKSSENATGVYFGYWPTYLDTYANLLYKVGKNSEAMKWQELALAKARERGISKSDIKAIEENLEMMKQGKPTWPEDIK